MNQQRWLIINADDFGMCHAANAAIVQLLKHGLVSSASLMVPCSWSAGAVSMCRHHSAWDIGVHLTFTSEWAPYRWGPVSVHADTESLVTDSGHFPRTVEEVEQRADARQVRSEIFAQIQDAMRMGLDPTHLDIHMGSLYGMKTGRDFLGEVFEACEHFQLPLRLPRDRAAGGELPDHLQEQVCRRIAEAEDRGVELIDHLETLPHVSGTGKAAVPSYTALKQMAMQQIHGFKPGITEWYFHPSLANEEWRVMGGDWERRRMEFDLLCDPDLHRTLKEEGVEPMSWRKLREKQRSK